MRDEETDDEWRHVVVVAAAAAAAATAATDKIACLTRDSYRLTEIAGLDNDERIWAVNCHWLKISVGRFHQLTGMYIRFESVL